ncbi:hypothetical protein NEUTE1DRAFT_124817 [Neurospora tetrasperma FGSC 2508]|uniref:Uncharacterized protein n=1 Tax=Neurospora tetrasperma (strain FGSC 2508 / ATCC MYA-4615 / P0657) TaxID=510951 RepID=F8MUW5_NEUT8|nr:uncharacterized protein NEUTE1DRAFT_124817 [Neurospora tetrasperma FGSC 2508]EGO54590.1 hypothetical protein NEUTE1DRAFT_124817 [Neurospora tetrasperma FGSC 2508]
MVVCTPAMWALVHPRTSCRSIVGKDHSRHMKRYQELGTLGYPSPSRTQPNHALTRRTSTSTLSLNMKQEPSTYTENALSRCKPLQTSHRNYMDQVDRLHFAHSLSSFTFIILSTSASQCILETD